MIIKEQYMKGVYLIQLEQIRDNRGFFTRIFDDKTFEENGIPTKWVQENHSFTKYKNTIRGLHFQLPPHSETKLIRVVNGEICDVFLDLRKNSLTFGMWNTIILTSENNKMLALPKGFAHGYITLTDNCDVLYKVDNYYNPHKESGINWNNQKLHLPVLRDQSLIISEKDSKLQTFKEFVDKYGAIEV